MAITATSTSNPFPSATEENEIVARSQQSTEGEQPRTHLFGLNERNSSFLEQITSYSRVLIIEGISGSGKDTFQRYLKAKLRDRVVYNYSEGDLLLSWNQRPIKDIFRLQIRLMRNFLEYVATTLERDDKAIFLLNRFHLSTYTMGVTEQPKLEREYNTVLKLLRRLPTHVFVLQLLENEIESRSSHPERGAAWQKFQEHILQREGFQNFLKRNVTLQQAMIETAVRQKIPFSILRIPSIGQSQITRLSEQFDKSFEAGSQKLFRKQRAVETLL